MWIPGPDPYRVVAGRGRGYACTCAHCVVLVVVNIEKKDKNNSILARIISGIIVHRY